ncbi:MAG: YdcF family protein [Treponema sp.]|jgi:SanA protein|nr:YdcF family protein [Treponema sp.]
MILPLNKILKRGGLVVLLLILGTALVTLAINIGMIIAARKYVYTDIEEIPSRTAVLVLGSQIRGTRLSPVLQDRVDAGIRLMENSKGAKLLLSGDHGQIYYDEVNAMRLYVLEHAPDIREEDIFMDHAGFSTWDSMYRARDVFEVKDVLIVTQEFHISRAVCMARSLGLDAVGYSVNQDRFRGQSLRAWQLREYFARVKAFYSIVVKPKPRYLGDKIPITGDGRATWI